MPRYDYRCVEGHEFEARHGFDAPAPTCPLCGTSQVTKLIKTAPRQLMGMLANAGDARRASPEQLQDKWREETPKLREKLVSKLGEETVNRYAPTLKPSTD